MTAALALSGVVAWLLVGFWLTYRLVMALQARKGAAYYVVLPFGLAYDFAMQVTVFSLLFLDPPREWLVTQRLIRYKRVGSGWRARLATWICESLLDPHDPSGCHCK